MKNASDVLKMIKDKDVKFVDFRFTDTKGKMQHVTAHASCVDEDTFADGYAFDGSSIAGWKGIESSDMLLMPDAATAHLDPFFAQSTVALFCDVLEPTTGQFYERDPRGIAKKAEAYMKSTGVGDTVFFGPEAEFFIFDDVRFSADPYNAGFKIDSTELPTNTGTEYEMGNLGHRPRTKGGYFPVPPIDSCQDIRSEMLSVMTEMGVAVEKHHHEVAAAQHELGIKFAPMVDDRRPSCRSTSTSCTWSRRPTARRRASCPSRSSATTARACTCTSRSGRAATPVFAGNKYADLSETCLSYIAGILKHAKAINAFTNPTTNSYKRLVPGYEAPVLLAYSARNRSASCRIPHATNPKAKRVEVRFPDPAANPYLGFTAMLMAGLDGIANKLNPGDADRQEPLRPAAGRARQDPDRLRQPARGTRQPRQGPRLPQDGRRHDRRHDRRLHRAEDGGEHALRDGAASDRVRHVLLGLIGG